MYKSIPCISRPPILEPKNKFFLFLWKNFLFDLRISFQIRYGLMKKENTTSLDVKFTISFTWAVFQIGLHDDKKYGQLKLPRLKAGREALISCNRKNKYSSLFSGFHCTLDLFLYRRNMNFNTLVEWHAVTTSWRMRQFVVWVTWPLISKGYFSQKA